MQFKKGDKVECISAVDPLIEGNVYTISSVYLWYIELLELGSGGWFPDRFKLYVEPEKSDTVSFKIVEWKDWVNDTSNQIEKAIKDGNLSIFSVVTSPKLDMEDPNSFCEEYCSEGVYESNVFVKHHSEKNCYWYITNSATLIYNPKFN